MLVDLASGADVDDTDSLLRDDETRLKNLLKPLFDDGTSRAMFEPAAVFEESESDSKII